jgi:hypothetical protein
MRSPTAISPLACAFGIGIAAWLGLDFVAEVRDEGPPSKTVVAAGEALDVVLGLLQA